MALAAALWGSAALLAIAVAGVLAQRMAAGSRLVYLACLVVSLTVLAVNLIGDGLRDAADPRLARRA